MRLKRPAKPSLEKRTEMQRQESNKVQIQGDGSKHLLSFYDMPRAEDKVEQALHPGMRFIANMDGGRGKDLLSSACGFLL